MSSRLNPALPSHLPTILGPIPLIGVSQVDDADALGQTIFEIRTIYLKHTACHLTQLTTAGHELFHTVLEDTGWGSKVPADVQEGLCDAFGTWFARAIIDGKLILK